MMKIGFGQWYHTGRHRFSGTQAVTHWCLEPVVESGPDVATNLKLLPRTVREHAEQSVSPSTSSGDLVPGETTMDTIYSNVAGLDVHQKTILACVRGVN